MLKKDANKKKINKKINIKSKMKLMLKNKKMIIIFIAILVLIATITAAITIPQIISKIQAEKNSLLSYEVVKQVDEGKYKILITVKSDSGIEYIKLPDGDTLKVTDQRTKVGIDYTVLDEVKYDFVIKQVGKDEVTESIYKEVQKIIQKHIEIRHIKGGEATKKKYLKMQYKLRVKEYKKNSKTGISGVDGDITHPNEI